MELVDIGLDMQLRAADKRINDLLQVVAVHAMETHDRAGRTENSAHLFMAKLKERVVVMKT